MLILLTINGVGIGLILPCLDALITEGINKEQRGTITSLYSSMRFIGVAAGPLVTFAIVREGTIHVFDIHGNRIRLHFNCTICDQVQKDRIRCEINRKLDDYHDAVMTIGVSTPRSINL